MLWQLHPLQVNEADIRATTTPTSPLPCIEVLYAKVSTLRSRAGLDFVRSKRSRSSGELLTMLCLAMPGPVGHSLLMRWVEHVERRTDA
jgi:hypothetical protein